MERWEVEKDFPSFCSGTWKRMNKIMYNIDLQRTIDVDILYIIINE